MDGFEWTVTGGQLLALLGVLLVVVLVAVAGRVLLAAAVIVAAQWVVITYWAENTTLVWVVLAVPALLAGYTLADGLTGSTGLGSGSRASGRCAGDERSGLTGRLLSPGLLIGRRFGLMVARRRDAVGRPGAPGAAIRRCARPGIRRRRARRPGPTWGRSGALVGAACVGWADHRCAVAGGQHRHPAVAPSAAAMLVLGVPGFLAGATVVRLLAVIGIVLHRRRRAAGRGRGGRR